MPSRFFQAIGIERSDEEREARGRAARTSRHSSRVGRVPPSRHRSAKLRTKERHSRSLMSATTGSESERKSRKKSTIRSNSRKKRSPRRRKETDAERLARRRERKEEKRREAEGSVVGETGVMEDEAEPVPSVEDEEPTSARLGISVLCDIPQQQAVDVFQFQSDWSDDEDAGKTSIEQPEIIVEPAARYEDHPAEYESATDGQETDHHEQEEHFFDDHHLQEVHPDTEHRSSVEDDNSMATTTDEPVPPTQPLRNLAASVANETEEDVPIPMSEDFNFSSPSRTVSSNGSFTSNNSHFSEPHDDVETGRSTSPETSFKSPSPLHASPLRQDHETPTQPDREEAERPETPSTTKLAAQTLAAEHRQRTIRRRSSHHMRRPEMPRHYPSAPGLPYQNPWIPNQPHPSQALSPIPPYNPLGQAMAPHIPGYPPATSPMQMSPRIPVDAQGHPPPLTGYAALATALSPHASTSPGPASAVFQPAQTLPPLYRRFTSLNHRLLLHLQDELSELEEELAYLDGLDTAQRTHPSSAPGRLVIRPASRRQAALSGSELEWRKSDVMGRISAKLHLYNETLARFQATEGLSRPREEDVEVYGEYLTSKRLLIDAESSYIGHGEDLVSLAPATRGVHGYAHVEEEGGMRVRARPQRRLTATAHSDEQDMGSKHTICSGQPAHGLREQQEQTLWLSALISILLPILVFHIIPDFMGRMVVALLIGLGLLGLLLQTGATELLSLERGGRRVVGGLWGTGMVLLALIV